MCNYIEIAANVLLTSELEDVIGDVRLSFSQVYTLWAQAVDHEVA